MKTLIPAAVRCFPHLMIQIASANVRPMRCFGCSRDCYFQAATWILHFGFTVAPILAGLDEFLHPSPRLASISAPALAGRMVAVPVGQS